MNSLTYSGKHEFSDAFSSCPEGMTKFIIRSDTQESPDAKMAVFIESKSGEKDFTAALSGLAGSGATASLVGMQKYVVTVGR